MNLAATLEIYAGGPGSGCTGPNCGRPATGEKEKPASANTHWPKYMPPVAEQQKAHEEIHPKQYMHQRPSFAESPWLSLEIDNPRGFPTEFHNDERVTWSWKGDTLTIEAIDETENESSMGMQVATVYKIPKKHITYWGPEAQSPAVQKRKGRLSSPDYEPGYVMAHGTSEGVKKEWETREHGGPTITVEKRVPLSWWKKLTPARQAAELKLAEMRNQRLVPYGKK